ncbi:DUF4429 domain-containing protein [Globicatella sanguinis]
MFGRKKDENQYQNYDGQVYKFQKGKITVRIDGNFIRIKREGLGNLLLHGIDGEKTIVISKITAYQLKMPGKTTGYLQIAYPGSIESKAGAWDAVQDENTIPFLAGEEESIYQVVDILDSKLS